ncbi:uncharacterized protein LOC130697838 [Daphnia carinata]|uniref:uncharacterized protein LOC130697838 n=1 Tax=Daphnia carinata TaxID=120202 RepID=UPI00257D1B53|nr:uncharacterized protein LOC130697838 [Daphnia carinata]
MNVLVCTVLLASVLLASAHPEEQGRTDTSGPLRFLVTPKTITSTVTVTSTGTATVGITTSCVKPAAGLANCRKRRNVMEVPLILEVEDDEEIDPSEPIEVVVTAYPEMRSLEDSSAVPVMEVQPSIDNTAGMVEVQIYDMDSICKARLANPFFGVGLAQLFGITVLHSTTVTATQQVTSTTTTVAKMNTIELAGCLPSPLPFSVCK